MEFENDKGKNSKSTTELFLVVAVSASDAEAKIYTATTMVNF